MGVINRDSRRIKLKGYTFTSAAGSTVTIDLQQPGDCNTLIGLNIYANNGTNTTGKKVSLTVNSANILDNIDAVEMNPTFNNCAKPYLGIAAELAGTDAIKLQWTDTATTNYTVNIYYYY